MVIFINLYSEHGKTKETVKCQLKNTGDEIMDIMSFVRIMFNNKINERRSIDVSKTTKENKNGDGNGTNKNGDDTKENKTKEYLNK